jgi:hypothetical protein
VAVAVRILQGSLPVALGKQPNAIRVFFTRSPFVVSLKRAFIAISSIGNVDHVRSSHNPCHSGSGTQFKRLEEKLANKQRLRPKVQLEQLRHRLTREYEHLKTSVEQRRKAREEGFDTQREAFNKQTGETLARCVCCAVAYGCWIHRSRRCDAGRRSDWPSHPNWRGRFFPAGMNSHVQNTSVSIRRSTLVITKLTFSDVSGVCDRIGTDVQFLVFKFFIAAQRASL